MQRQKREARARDSDIDTLSENRTRGSGASCLVRRVRSSNASHGGMEAQNHGRANKLTTVNNKQPQPWEGERTVPDANDDRPAGARRRRRRGGGETRTTRSDGGTREGASDATARQCTPPKVSASGRPHVRNKTSASDCVWRVGRGVILAFFLNSLLKDRSKIDNAPPADR